MLFIRQSPMLLSTGCRVSFPRLGARALAARTTELSRDLVRLRIPRIGAEQFLKDLHQGVETVVEIPLPRPERAGAQRSICCFGQANVTVTPTSLRLDVHVDRFSIRKRRESARPADPPQPLQMGKGAGR